jgi:integrase
VREFTSRLAPKIKEYLEFRKMLGYYSSGHEDVLEKFDSYCHEHYPESETLTKDSVRGWIGYEISQGRRRIYKKATPLRMLARYMGEGAYILPDKATPHSPRYTPYILNDDELSRLFVAADSITAFPGHDSTTLKFIFSTLLRLMYTCGLRPQEVRQIKYDNINFDTGEILIEKGKGCKGSKERIVIMSDDMLAQCRKYDVARAVENPQSEYFFVRKDGMPVPAYQLADTFRRCWRQANHDVPANMLPRLRPYDLRHRFATTVLQKWLSAGLDFYVMLPYLRAYMGHEHFFQTAYYIHLLPEHLLSSAGVDWSIIDEVEPEVDVWEN